MQRITTASLTALLIMMTMMTVMMMAFLSGRFRRMWQSSSGTSSAVIAARQAPLANFSGLASVYLTTVWRPSCSASVAMTATAPLLLLQRYVTVQKYASHANICASSGQPLLQARMHTDASAASLALRCVSYMELANPWDQLDVEINNL